QPFGGALDLVRQSPERQSIDKDSVAGGDGREHAIRVIACGRRGEWKAGGELVDHDGPAALAEPGDHAPVVCVPAREALQRPGNDENEGAHGATSVPLNAEGGRR